MEAVEYQRLDLVLRMGREVFSKVTVVGLDGRTLLDAAEVSSLTELEGLVLMKMGSGKWCSCRLLTADGHPLSALEEAATR